jgi:UDP-glucose 4-epimerase
MTGSPRSSLAVSLPGEVPAALQPGCKVVVTGCAGFIGSRLSEALLALGCRVVGVDALTDYYDPALKRENLANCLAQEQFTFHERDLLELDPVPLLGGATACFHLAAQAGVRASWGSFFTEYLARNVHSTQHLLEGCLHETVRRNLVRFVYSSSSSVYGDQEQLPVTEQALPQPRSPYGVTKLAGEHLCVLYADNFGIPISSLRYFTVYGPRQRPDMAFRKFIERVLAHQAFRVYGDGSQTRDFTYVDDAVRANLLAIKPTSPSEILNVGGGTRISLREALTSLQELLAAADGSLRPELVYEEMAKGDVRDTFADRSHVAEVIGYEPLIPFADGLAREVDWALARRDRRG